MATATVSSQLPFMGGGSDSGVPSGAVSGEAFGGESASVSKQRTSSADAKGHLASPSSARAAEPVRGDDASEETHAHGGKAGDDEEVFQMDAEVAEQPLGGSERRASSRAVAHGGSSTPEKQGGSAVPDRTARGAMHASSSKAEPRASKDGAGAAAPQRSEGRKGTPWTEDEHVAFLDGLKALGKGNWRGIAKKYVPTRTPTQVASHAQKHFLRMKGATKRKSRFTALEEAFNNSCAAEQAGADMVAGAAQGAEDLTRAAQAQAHPFLQGMPFPPGAFGGGGMTPHQQQMSYLHYHHHQQQLLRAAMMSAISTAAGMGGAGSPLQSMTRSISAPNLSAQSSPAAAGASPLGASPSTSPLAHASSAAGELGPQQQVGNVPLMQAMMSLVQQAQAAMDPQAPRPLVHRPVPSRPSASSVWTQSSPPQDVPSLARVSPHLKALTHVASAPSLLAMSSPLKKRAMSGGLPSLVIQEGEEGAEAGGNAEPAPSPP